MLLSCFFFAVVSVVVIVIIVGGGGGVLSLLLQLFWWWWKGVAVAVAVLVVVLSLAEETRLVEHEGKRGMSEKVDNRRPKKRSERVRPGMFFVVFGQSPSRDLERLHHRTTSVTALISQ